MTLKNFIFEPLPLSGLIKIQATGYPDDRGIFVEIFKESMFKEAGLVHSYVQDNYSHSKKNVLRGLHYQQHPASQAKLIRCLQGEIFDVAVDIRKSSPTYGRWFGLKLTGDEYTMLHIPAGFAHGFIVRSETADILYKCSAEYSPADERGICWNDPVLNIHWNCPDPIVSKKDGALPLLREAENNFE